MKKILAFFVALYVFFPLVRAEESSVADSADFYIFTATPGEELYATFGHSALRVVNYTRQYDVVYNWGTFDFDTPHFYLKFGTGRLMYFLSIADYEHFLSFYRENGQGIYEQKLNLTSREKARLLHNLADNYTEANRYYRYDFFYDNCATRIRDIIEKSVDGKLVYDTTYVKNNSSFRHLLGTRLTSSPWIYFGMNILIGSNGDRIAAMRDYMFLPEHLKNLCTSAKVISGDSVRLLTSPPKELVKPTLVFETPSTMESPLMICWILFIVILAVTVWEYKSNRNFRLLDVFLFLTTALIGVLIAWLWSTSLHVCLHNNLNIVWANPIGLLIVIGLNKVGKAAWLRIVVWAYIVALLVLIPASFFLTQEMHSAAYPIIGIMLVRAFKLVKS
jgi:hypothetical protein